MTSIWTAFTALGDSAVLLPVASVMAAWMLWQPALRRLGAWWVGGYLGCIAVVAASKVAYMGWFVHPPGMDFVGISGHSALSMMVWATLGGLLSARLPGAWRWSGLVAGAALALAIAVSRVVLHAHTPSEAVAGVLLGAALQALVQRHAEAEGSARPLAVIALVGALALPTVIAYGQRFPSNPLLERVATSLSGRPSAYTRAELERALARD